MAGLIARVAPALIKAASSPLGQAAGRGMLAGTEMGVAGRVANMIQGKKDGQGTTQQRENMNGYVPGRGAY